MKRVIKRKMKENRLRRNHLMVLTRRLSLKKVLNINFPALFFSFPPPRRGNKI